ncbi:MAG: carbohydrate-binding protein, partial [Salinicola sp.]|uniref:carbohydrate-binding protein n=1 Tax=Salinicola sp. TaxID=1978524 RepID=UPI001D3E7FAD
VEQDGATYTSAAPHAVTNTGGWNNYQTNDGIELDLAAGEQTLRLTFNGGAMNLQSFTLTPEANAATTSTASFLSMMAAGVDNGLGSLPSLDDVLVPNDEVALAGVDQPEHVGVA